MVIHVDLVIKLFNKRYLLVISMLYYKGGTEFISHGE